MAISFPQIFNNMAWKSTSRRWESDHARDIWKACQGVIRIIHLKEFNEKADKTPPRSLERTLIKLDSRAKLISNLAPLWKL